ncbi:MAG: oxygenase MpaB family protein, partial [Bdellovibrionota bacterium]
MNAYSPSAFPPEKWAAIVDRPALEKSLDKIREIVRDPNQGLFGPDSVTWRVIAPLPVLSIGLFQAGLLEAPHPYVGFGTAKHSRVAKDPLGRFERSIRAFFDWYFG